MPTTSTVLRLLARFVSIPRYFSTWEPVYLAGITQDPEGDTLPRIFYGGPYYFESHGNIHFAVILVGFETEVELENYLHERRANDNLRRLDPTLEIDRSAMEQHRREMRVNHAEGGHWAIEAARVPREARLSNSTAPPPALRDERVIVPVEVRPPGRMGAVTTVTTALPMVSRK
jgi:hypothetical protein